MDGRFERPRPRAVFARENNARNFFLRLFSIRKDTGSHLRDKIGTKRLVELFSDFNAQLKTQGLIADPNEAYRMIETRLSKRLKTFNNKTVKKVATDIQARI